MLHPPHPKPIPKRQSTLRMAVIGGGPAGSSFALFALDFARRSNVPVEITIFEPRDFSRPGPWGCNMGAGLIPLRMLRQLATIGVTIPSHVVRNRIDSYNLHTVAGQIHVPQPDPEGDIVSVYRGNGPRQAPQGPEIISFDHFLLLTAQKRGAKVIRARVSDVSLTAESRHVVADGKPFPCDLVVLACGINKTRIRWQGVDYQPPRRSQMAQAEMLLGEGGVKQALGNSVHIVLPKGGLKFGTIVPKGPFVNISLLGEDLPMGSVKQFMQLPQVVGIFPPSQAARACSCRPNIAVDAAPLLYADGFVVIGDAGVTRLYKNGIGTALRTARQAAFTAVNYDITESAFRKHYRPLCRRIVWDNAVGRLLFALGPVFANHDWFARAQLESIAAEQTLPAPKRRHSRLLWGMFTGVYSYSQLMRMVLDPRLQWRIGGFVVKDWLQRLLQKLRPLRQNGSPTRPPSFK
ncbi:MAG: hypothetical protein GXP38_04490 [Chloroflexi bacterium]|nr:hypothetical protein [Chloroflexota bacterium]